MTIDFEELRYNQWLARFGFIGALKGRGLSKEDIALLRTNNSLFSIIRRMVPKIIAQEIIGVQPMTGPIGQIHTLRTRYKN